MQRVTRVFRIILVSTILSLTGCGGGGGGSGSDGGPGKSAKTGVRVLHGVIDYAPLDLSLSTPEGAEQLQTSAFATSQIYAKLPEGPQVVSLARAKGSTSTLFSFPFTVEKNHRRSILFFGSTESLGLNATIITDDVDEIPEGKVAIRVVNSLVGAGQISAVSGPDLLSDGVSFGTASNYRFATPGIQPLSIKRVTDSRLVYSVARDFVVGKAYTVLVTGEVGFLVTSTVLEDSVD